MRNDKCLFLDLDGTCFSHTGDLYDIMTTKVVLLDGVVDFFKKCREDGVYMVITTARPESLRQFTISQMTKHGLWCDQLVMGLPTGKRIVINDNKPNGDGTARGICVERNKGLRSIVL